MTIDWWTMALQTINALVLIFILSRFLFRPVAGMIAARKAEAQAMLTDAAAARATAESAQQAMAEEAAALEADRAARRAAAAKEAEAEKAAMLAAARSEADGVVEAGKRAVEAMQAQAEDKASARASELALEIAARLMDRLPAEARVAGFVDGLAEAAASLPENVRAGIVAAGEPLALKAPRALTRHEATLCKSRLAEAFGGAVTLKVEVVPELIAGLELEAQHASVRNSLRADLARIAGELKRGADV